MAGTSVLPEGCRRARRPPRSRRRAARRLTTADQWPDRATCDGPGPSGTFKGVKFASVLGRVAAELAVDGSTPSAGDLEAFRIDRPILREARPATRFVV